MVKSLVSLKDHNDKARMNPKRFRETGIACPKCGTELIEKSSVAILTYPAQYPVDCPKCKFHGTRF